MLFGTNSNYFIKYKRLKKMSYFVGLEIFINIWKAFFYTYSKGIPKAFWNQILITLILIIFYRIGTYIPIPGIDTKSVSEILLLEKETLGIFNHIDFLMGGSLGRISIFSLNLVPYLSASLLFNLLMTSSKTFREKSKNQKASFLIQISTVFISVLQSYGILIYIEKINNHFYKQLGIEILVSEANGSYFTLSTILTLVGASLALQWMAQKITTYGVGNGITLILLTGVLAEISKSLWELSLISKIVICFTFLLVSYLILIVEQTSISIPISYLQHFSLWYEKQNSYVPYVTIPINVFGIIPLIIYQVLYGFLINSNLLFNELELSLTYYFIIQFLLLLASCLLVRNILVHSFSKKEILLLIRKQMLAFHGFHIGKEVSNYLNTIFNSLLGVNFLYFLLVSIIPEIIFNFVSSFYVLNDYHLNGITIFLIVKIIISIIKQIKNPFLFDITKQIGRKEAITSFFFKK